MSTTPLLTVRGLRVSYGPIIALRGVDFEVHHGEVVALIGSNGAGKSTLLRALSGLVPASGSARVIGSDGAPTELLKTQAHRIPRLGIAHVPEGRGIFLNLTVHENLRMGAYLRKDSAESRRDEEQLLGQFPRLRDRLRQPAITLSGGEQQMLAIARGLMARPRFLLLDEPSLGLAPKLVKEIFSIIDRLRGQGISILLVEQNARMALKVASRGCVLDTGRIVLSGDASSLAREPLVREAYLGHGT